MKRTIMMMIIAAAMAMPAMAHEKAESRPAMASEVAAPRPMGEGPAFASKKPAKEMRHDAPVRPHHCKGRSCKEPGCKNAAPAPKPAPKPAPAPAPRR